MNDAKKLWLDDKRPAPPGWTAVRTADEARDALARGGVDELSLDYTLRRTDDETGEDLVQWMRRTGNWPRRKPSVHSSNLYGRVRMALSIAWHWRVGHADASHPAHAG